MSKELKEKIIKYIKEFIAQDRSSEVLYQFYDLEIDITDCLLSEFDKYKDKLGAIKYWSTIVYGGAVNTLIVNINEVNNLYLQDCMYRISHVDDQDYSYKNGIDSFKLQMDRYNYVSETDNLYYLHEKYIKSICDHNGFVTFTKFKKPEMMDDEMFKDNIIKRQKLTIIIDQRWRGPCLGSVNITPIE